MYTYTLSLQDILTYNRYNLSLKKRKGFTIARFILSFYFLLLAGAMIYIESYIIGGLFVVIAIAYPFLGKAYMKWAYSNAFKKAIVTDCKGMIDSPITFQLSDENIVIEDQGGQCSYRLSSVESVIEIAGYFFIKISNSHVVIIPKNDEELNDSIKKMIADHDLNHVVNLGWKY
ncbi:MAG TPA: YcxB family protein [Pedobacter sp.]|uniref:YcxB family protein n=1 Tax=Pedobacter sp. TaxID=1411316 RepID=UPI002B5E1081|nr:YcxB family protein [Pedobacter sp.]HMI03701.1 YcxB family protein [Pedobacter sp.]